MLKAASWFCFYFPPLPTAAQLLPTSANSTGGLTGQEIVGKWTDAFKTCPEV
jgi:hypothetical protein